MTPRWKLLAAIAAGAVASACGGAGASGGGTTLTAHNFAFDPASLSVQPGQTVTLTFQNEDGVTHSFTTDGAPAVSVDAAGGSTQTVTFTAPQSGTLAFHCRYHPQMKGTITVGGGSGAGAGAAPSSTAAATPTGSSGGAPGNGGGYYP